MKARWYYAWIKGNDGRLVETRIMGHNKQDAYERLMALEQVQKYHPDLKLKDVRLSNIQH